MFLHSDMHIHIFYYIKDIQEARWGETCNTNKLTGVKVVSNGS